MAKTALVGYLYSMVTMLIVVIIIINIVIIIIIIIVIIFIKLINNILISNYSQKVIKITTSSKYIYHIVPK